VEDSVGDRSRARLVRDNHHGAAGEISQELEHCGAVCVIEVARRLVGEDDLGVVDERAGDREALLFATREFMRTAVGDGREAEVFY
jgi:predicted GNAT family acetyltransferase